MSTPMLQLNETRIAEARSLFKDAESVELKMTVADGDLYSATTALGLDVLDAELRQVVFFDTPDLTLDHAGIIVRARRARKGGDAVIKLRPLAPATVPAKLRHSSSFKIEVDVTPGGMVCSGSLKADTGNGEIKKVLAGKRAIHKLFSPEQRALYAKHAPEGLEMDALMPFGPINVAKLKFTLEISGGHNAVAELWFYPDSSRVLELSTKCGRDEAFQVLAEGRATLLSRGIRYAAEQQTKTRKALEYFARLHARPPK
jgi:hypothetical protein